MVRLDHSYGSPPDQANDHDPDQHSIHDVASEETVGEDSDGEINLFWREGRRVVELGVLSDQLAGCKMCSQPLSLQNCVGEKRYGLGTLLYIICDNKSCCHRNRLVLGNAASQQTKNMAFLVGT